MQWWRLVLLAAVAAVAAALAACTALRPGAGAEEEIRLPPASENSAVLALLEQARFETDGGRATGAVATLERALRIEPRNPQLWLELARHHLAQGDSMQAEQLAQRANGLAGSDKNMRAAGWQLIARARQARGDAAGAEQAEAKVRELRR